MNIALRLPDHCASSHTNPKLRMLVRMKMAVLILEVTMGRAVLIEGSEE